MTEEGPNQPSPPPEIPDLDLKPNWKTRLRTLLDQSQIAGRIQDFQPAAAAEWVGKAFQQQNASFYGKLVTIFLCSYFMADLTSLLVGGFIPEVPQTVIPGSSIGVGQRLGRTLEDYNVIFARNLFNSKGLIPGEEGPVNQDLGGPPVKSSLPLDLIGTLILKDELKSIATIEDKSASVVYPVRIQDEIPSKARILKIEPRRVIFLNEGSGRREYIDLPEEPESTGPKITLGAPTQGLGIEQTSSNEYNVSRNEVDHAFADLNNVLTQARAIPNMENGMPAGYRLVQIVPGSIYDKLGLKNGDVIQGLNGQPINDPGKAFEMLSELRSANHLELQVKREGRSFTSTYDIH